VSNPDQASQSMIDNLPASTGRSLEEWFAVLDGTHLTKHTELMNHLKQDHGVSHGFANGIVLRYRERGSVPANDGDLVAQQYAGAKTALRPIYDAIVAAVTEFGPDVEVAPKRTAVSLRRSKQFAVVEVPSAKRVQLGIQLKGDPVTERLLAGNAMCSHKVNLTDVRDVDDEVVDWLRAAYGRA
jgi:predicted transport protein